jgi:hypothetical protein
MIHSVAHTCSSSEEQRNPLPLQDKTFMVQISPGDLQSISMGPGQNGLDLLIGGAGATCELVKAHDAGHPNPLRLKLFQGFRVELLEGEV